jgi:hypothetical protein
MNNLRNLALLGAVLAASASSALATPVTYSTVGTFSSSGTNVATFGSGANTLTLTYIGPQNASVNTPTNATAGEFITTVTGSGASLSGTFNLTVDQTGPTAASGTFLDLLSGAISSNSSSGLVQFSNLTLNLGTSIYTLQQPPAGYFLVPPQSASGDTTVQMTITSAMSAPEPASLILLGTGMLGASALFFRRRRLAWS